MSAIRDSVGGRSGGACGGVLLDRLGHRRLPDRLENRNIASGFQFLWSTAGFGVNQALISYSEASSYGRALLVGFLNTLLVAGVGIVCATILGFVVGIMRLSRNWLVAKVAETYIEILRNIPLLLQIFVWYDGVEACRRRRGATARALAGRRLRHHGRRAGRRRLLRCAAFIFTQSVVLRHRDAAPILRRWTAGQASGELSLSTIISCRSAFFFQSRHHVSAAGPGEGAWMQVPRSSSASFCRWLIATWARRRQERTGQVPTIAVSLALIIGPFSPSGDRPETTFGSRAQGFNFRGGMTVIPNFWRWCRALDRRRSSPRSCRPASGGEPWADGAALHAGRPAGPDSSGSSHSAGVRVIIPPLAITSMHRIPRSRFHQLSTSWQWAARF
jgi:His/Glu/Gln/Arg/opine family amino acid ABC transporter permease subunit